MLQADRTPVPRLRIVAGLALALLLPALATCRIGFNDHGAALALAITPWLTLLWVLAGERRPLASVGLARPRPSIVPLALLGVAVNIAITAGGTLLLAKFGLRETQSALMERLLAGSGLMLTLLVTNGAFLTEISFRAYTVERLLQLTRGRTVVTAAIQIVVTTAIFVVGRGWAHGLIWLADDVVFTAYYLRSRNAMVCIVAHAVPNLLASSLFALGLAS